MVVVYQKQDNRQEKIGQIFNKNFPIAVDNLIDKNPTQNSYPSQAKPNGNPQN